MIKYMIGFAAGIGLTMAAAGPVNNCDNWKADAAVYEAMILMFVNGDKEAYGNIHDNVAKAAAQVLGRQSYEFEIFQLPKHELEILGKFTGRVVDQLVKNAEEARRVPTLDA